MRGGIAVVTLGGGGGAVVVVQYTLYTRYVLCIQDAKCRGGGEVETFLPGLRATKERERERRRWPPDCAGLDWIGLDWTGL